MMKHVGSVRVRRSHDGAQRSEPLRLEIGRRVARTRAGEEKFVTQVRMGAGSAVIVPWRAPPAVSVDSGANNVRTSSMS